MPILKGKKYRTKKLSPADVRPGAIVRIKDGLTSRRIVGSDGTDIILRGVISDDVLEAVDEELLLEKWLLLERAEGPS